MGNEPLRRDFLKKVGSIPCLGALGLAAFESSAWAQYPGGIPQPGAVPQITREDLVQLFVGPWQKLRAVIEKKGLFVDLSTRICAEDPAAYAGPALGGACSAAGSSARSHVHRTIRCHLLLMCKQQGRTGGIAAELYVDSGVGGVPGRDDRE